LIRGSAVNRRAGVLPAFLTSGRLLHLIKGFQHLFGSRPDSDIFREIYPVNSPSGINEKLRGVKFQPLRRVKDLPMENPASREIGRRIRN
jgi:hypothetical protein